VSAKRVRIKREVMLLVCLFGAMTVLAFPLLWDFIRSLQYVNDDARRLALYYEKNLKANTRCCDFLLDRLDEKNEKQPTYFRFANRVKELGLSVDDLDATEILTLCAAGLVFERDSLLYAEKVREGQQGIITGSTDRNFFLDNDQDGWFELQVPHSPRESFQLLVEGENYKVVWEMRGHPYKLETNQ
jgi:hypothetical protein